MRNIRPGACPTRCCCENDHKRHWCEDNHNNKCCNDDHKRHRCEDNHNNKCCNR